jgi:hypothetical protein
MSYFCTDCIVGLVVDNPDVDVKIEDIYKDVTPEIDVFVIFDSLKEGEKIEFSPCKGCGLNSIAKDKISSKLKVTYQINPPITDLDEIPQVFYPDRRINSHFTSHHAKSRFIKMVRLAKQADKK